MLLCGVEVIKRIFLSKRCDVDCEAFYDVECSQASFNFKATRVLRSTARFSMQLNWFDTKTLFQDVNCESFDSLSCRTSLSWKKILVTLTCL